VGIRALGASVGSGAEGVAGFQVPFERAVVKGVVLPHPDGVDIGQFVSAFLLSVRAFLG
jgi:hypothetical protein